MSRVCPWDASGASDRQIPLCDFSLSVFFSPYSVTLSFETTLLKQNSDRFLHILPRFTLGVSASSFTVFESRYRPKGVLGKGVCNNKNSSKMSQKCVKNAPKCVLFYWEKRNVPKCVKNESKTRLTCVKMRGTPLGEKTFWTMPMKGPRPRDRFVVGGGSKATCFAAFLWRPLSCLVGVNFLP